MIGDEHSPRLQRPHEEDHARQPEDEVTDAAEAAWGRGARAEAVAMLLTGAAPASGAALRESAPQWAPRLQDALASLEEAQARHGESRGTESPLARRWLLETYGLRARPLSPPTSGMSLPDVDVARATLGPDEAGLAPSSAVCTSAQGDDDDDDDDDCGLPDAAWEADTVAEGLLARLLHRLPAASSRLLAARACMTPPDACATESTASLLDTSAFVLGVQQAILTTLHTGTATRFDGPVRSSDAMGCSPTRGVSPSLRLRDKSLVGRPHALVLDALARFSVLVLACATTAFARRPLGDDRKNLILLLTTCAIVASQTAVSSGMRAGARSQTLALAIRSVARAFSGDAARNDDADADANASAAAQDAAPCLGGPRENADASPGGSDHEHDRVILVRLLRALRGPDAGGPDDDGCGCQRARDVLAALSGSSFEGDARRLMREMHALSGGDADAVPYCPGCPGCPPGADALRHDAPP